MLMRVVPRRVRRAFQFRFFDAPDAMHRLASLFTVVCLLACLGPARAENAPGATADAASANAALKTLDVAFVESDLRLPGLAAPAEPDPDLVGWKVPEFGRLLLERAPIVLAANGLSGHAVLIPTPAPGTEPDLTSLAPGRPVLLLRIALVTKSTPRLFTKAGSVAFDARLLADPATAGAPHWQGLLIGKQLGFDPVLGVLKTNRVDAAWVDALLVAELDQFAQQGALQLSGPRALSPKD